MFYVSSDSKDNILYLYLSGKIEYYEIEEIFVQIKSEIKNLKKGFTTVTDLHEFVPAAYVYSSMKGKELLYDIMEFLHEFGMGKALRITGNTASEVGNMLFTDNSNDLGYFAETITEDHFKKTKEYQYLRKEKKIKD